MSDTQVAITLLPVDNQEDPTPASRYLTLSEDNPVIPLGRSSKREARNREPASDNGWYESRVMSREHAELSLENEHVYIYDSGSTHGTWLNNLKLIQEQKTPLLNGDILRFGVNVDRGHEEFPALSVRCEIKWSEKDSVEEIPKLNIPEPKSISVFNPEDAPRPTSSSNTFCVPEDDSDIEEVPVKNVTLTGFDGASASNIPPSVRAAPKLHDLINLEDDQEAHLKHEHQADPPKQFSVWDSGPGDAYAEQESDHEYVLSEYSDEESDLESSKSTSSHTSEGEVVTKQFKFVERSESPEDAISDDDPDLSENDKDECIDPRVLAQKNSLEPPLSDKFENAWMAQKAAPPISPIKPFNTRLPPPAYPYAPYGRNYSPPAPTEAGNLAGTHIPGTHVPIQLSSYYDPINSPYPGYRDGPFSWDCQSVPVPHSPTHFPSSWSQLSSLKHRMPDSRDNFSEIHKDKIETAHENETLLKPTSSAMKRKASEMESQDNLQDAQKPDLVYPASQEPELDEISQSQVVSAITSALSEAGENSELEPPTKKLKPSPAPPKNLTRYTATAVVSALLGGLGTIALLAALPAEYFQ